MTLFRPNDMVGSVCDMRVLVINHDHPQFQRSFYSTLSDVDSKSYGELMALRHASLFGLAGFYSSNLKSLGHEAGMSA
jgi:hypothetical protein